MEGWGGSGPREPAAPRCAARRAVFCCVASVSLAVSTGPRRTALTGLRAALPQDRRSRTKAAGLCGSGLRGFTSSLTSRCGRVWHLAGRRHFRAPRQEQTPGSGVLPSIPSSGRSPGSGWRRSHWPFRGQGSYRPQGRAVPWPSLGAVHPGNSPGRTGRPRPALSLGRRGAPHAGDALAHGLSHGGHLWRPERTSARAPHAAPFRDAPGFVAPPHRVAPRCSFSARTTLRVTRRCWPRRAPRDPVPPRDSCPRRSGGRAGPSADLGQTLSWPFSRGGWSSSH